MRKVMELQMKIGSVDISKIEFDLRSRDEIPKLLMGLQHIYCNELLRAEIFGILEDLVPGNINKDTGRRGMDLWNILVLGTLRLNCNWDYDKLQDIANNHKTLRLMLGHGEFDDDYYPLQTLRDNVCLLTPEVLDKINQIVVKEGHLVAGKKKELTGRCDSFVVETNVHYPTDINLLLDAIRKVVTLTARLCAENAIPGWRQSKHILSKIKRRYRHAQNAKRMSMKNSEKKQALVMAAHRDYIDLVSDLLTRAQQSLKEFAGTDLSGMAKPLQIMGFIAHATRQIDQIERRVMKGEKIPHHEKVFSIFEEHTEWICKGKAGVPQELGLRVCVLEDNYGFFLHHRVMQKETDEKVAVAMVEAAREKFPDLAACSFDRGFHSPENQEALKKILTHVALPRKGKQAANEESEQEFVNARRSHSLVESAISALENHGLDRCPDRRIRGFERYVALAVLARDIQILGNMLQKAKLDKKMRQEKLRKKKKAA